MLRHYLMQRPRQADTEFRWRGKEVSRLENFSDAAFGFALTLLVVSQQVPQNFEQLMATLRGFPTFLLCFVMLANIWYSQYLFFRHYGMHDILTVRLNMLLLVMVLYAVYPLKFLVTLTVAYFFHLMPPEGAHHFLTTQQLPTLFAVYGLGLAAVFGIFMLLHTHAYRQRERLELTPLELFDTRARVISYGLVMMVALGSVAIAGDGVPRHSLWAGLIYLTILAIRLWDATVVRARRRALQARLHAVVPDRSPSAASSERAEEPVAEIAQAGQDVASVV